MKSASSRRGARPRKRSAASSRNSVSRYKTDWARVDAITEEELYANALSDPDAQPTTPEFWKNARIVYPKGKHPITLRLDSDILTWFRLKKGYQTEINAILRTYMEAHRGKRPARAARRTRRSASRLGAAAE